MDEVSCNGSEVKIEDCDHSDVHDCGSTEGAGVVCTNIGKYDISKFILHLKKYYPYSFCISLIKLDNKSFAELVHTDKGTTCSDKGLLDLFTDQECADALYYAKSFVGAALYLGSGSWSENHKGCYIYQNGDMYFNTHSFGNNNANMRSICKKGKK